MVKYWIGVDVVEDYVFVCDFVGMVVEVGCEMFVVYVCNVILKGLLLKENCEILLFKYDYVYWLKCDFLLLEIVINGGIMMFDEVVQYFEYVDGVMFGCEVYYNLYVLVEVDVCFYGFIVVVLMCEEVEV